MPTDNGPTDALLRLFLEISKDESLTKTAERLNGFVVVERLNCHSLYKRRSS